jgi:hypothetical protein
MALLLALGVCLAGATTAAPTCAQQQVSEQARTLFRDGVKLLKAEGGANYYAAYQKFRAAYADSPSPKILGNLGLCALKLERYGEARDAYERYIADAPGVTAKERKAIEAELAQLRDNAAELRLSASVPSFAVRDERRTRDGKLVVNDYQSDGSELALVVRPGTHQLRVEAAGYDSASLTLELEAGAKQEQAVELTAVASDAPPLDPSADAVADEQPSEGLPLGFWIGLGVTGAAGVATGVMAGLTAAKHGEFEDAQASGQLAEAVELQSDGETFALTTDILIGVTAAAAVTTAVFLVAGLTSDDDSDPEPSAKWRVYPMAGRRVLGGGASYTF